MINDAATIWTLLEYSDGNRCLSWSFLLTNGKVWASK